MSDFPKTPNYNPNRNPNPNLNHNKKASGLNYSGLKSKDIIKIPLIHSALSIIPACKNVLYLQKFPCVNDFATLAFSSDTFSQGTVINLLPSDGRAERYSTHLRQVGANESQNG